MHPNLLQECCTTIDSKPVVRQKPLSVVVVDAPCFTLSYDFSLCEALTQNQCKVLLARSEYSYATWCAAGSFESWKNFYPLSGKLARAALPASGRRLLKAVEHVRDMRRFVSEMRLRKPDVIHFQWLPIPALDTPYLRQLRRIAPLVLTAHNTNLYHGDKRLRLLGVGFRNAVRYFDALIVHTAFSESRVLANGWLAPQKVAVVPHGVLDYYRSLVGQADGQSHDSAHNFGQTVLFFGNIKPYKGLDVLLRAFHALPSVTRSRSRLVIAGRPNFDIGPMRKLSLDLGIDSQVTWNLGFLDETEVAALFRSATVAALPYKEIDQSGVMMTAIAFDTPVVASHLEGFAETITDGVHGYLVPPGDVAAFASGLDRVLTKSPEEMNEMRQAICLLRTGKLSWDSCAKQTLKVYDGVIRSRAGLEPSNIA